MSTLSTTIQNESGIKLEGITINCEFYIQYNNTSTSRIMNSGVLSELIGSTDSKGVSALSSERITTSKEFTKYWELYTDNVKKGKINRCLDGDTKTNPIENQLKELKSWISENKVLYYNNK